jgi:hypothetical protein
MSDVLFDVVDDTATFDPDAPEVTLEDGRAYQGHITKCELTGWRYSGNSGQYYQGIRVVLEPAEISGWATTFLNTLWRARDGEGEGAEVCSTTKPGGVFFFSSVKEAIRLFQGIGAVSPGAIHPHKALMSAIQNAPGTPVIFRVTASEGANGRTYFNVESRDISPWPEGTRQENGLPF